MPQMTWQPAPSIPLASQPSSWRRPVSYPSIPGCCPPISFSVCLVFYRIVLESPEDLVMCPYHFSLRRFTVVKRSSWGPMACRILFRTSSFEMWSLQVMPRSFLRHLISMACILLSVSAVSVQDSQAYMNVDMIREHISLIFELSAIFLSFQMVLSFASAAVAWAILARISGLDPSSAMIAPRYLNLLTQSSFSPLALMSVLKPLVLLAISLVFSALMCMLMAVEVLSRRSTKSASSSSLPARPSMSLANRKFVIFLPPMLTVPSWSFSASVIILSKKMLKRVGESTQPC